MVCNCFTTPLVVCLVVQTTNWSSLAKFACHCCLEGNLDFSCQSILRCLLDLGSAVFVRDPVVSSSLVPSPSEMVASSSVTSCSNATTPVAPIDRPTWPTIYVGLFGLPVLAASLTFLEILLFMHSIASSAASTDLLQLPISYWSLVKHNTWDGPAWLAVCAGLFGGLM